MRISPILVTVILLSLIVGTLSLPQQSIAEHALERWTVNFQDFVSSGLGSSPMNCYFADQTRTLALDPRSGVGDFVLAGGAKIPAKVKTSVHSNVEITFDIEPGEPVIMIGSLTANTATGTWKAGTLSCGGTWTARQLDEQH